MSEEDEVWLQLVDEPIAAIVAEVEAEDPELRALVASPEKLLAFRTFANIRVGIVLGRLLVENEVEAYDGSGTWVESLLENPGHRREIVAEVRAVAEELARGRGRGPDEATPRGSASSPAASSATSWLTRARFAFAARLGDRACCVLQLARRRRRGRSRRIPLR